MNIKCLSMMMIGMWALPMQAEEVSIEVCGQYSSEKAYKEQALIKVLDQHGSKSVSGYESNSNAGEVSSVIDVSSTLSIHSIKLAKPAKFASSDCRKFNVIY
ncbi:hypothetical protein ACRZ5S_22945 (plasmid) [Vibrio scophthalmi]|uniref:hypothetical protein n=1 Tax=Vibrio scophthalmi TaxID=45658 RepID=UPI003EBFC05F